MKYPACHLKTRLLHRNFWTAVLLFVLKSSIALPNSCLMPPNFTSHRKYYVGRASLYYLYQINQLEGDNDQIPAFQLVLKGISEQHCCTREIKLARYSPSLDTSTCRHTSITVCYLYFNHKNNIIFIECWPRGLGLSIDNMPSPGG